MAAAPPTEPAGVDGGAYRPPSPTIRLPKIAEVVAGTIRRDIVKGVLKEGDNLPAEAVLVERFGVSKPSIREAIRLLESEGLIEVRRGAAGARVRVPDERSAGRAVGTLLQLAGTTLADLWHAREIFEPPLAGELAEGRDDRDLRELRAAIDVQRRTLSDPPAFAAAVTDFHVIVVTLAGNSTLTTVTKLLEEVIRLHANTVASTFEAPQHDHLRSTALAEHATLVDLISQRRATEATNLWRKHLRTQAAIALAQSDAHSVLDLYADAGLANPIQLRL